MEETSWVSFSVHSMKGVQIDKNTIKAPNFSSRHRYCGLERDLWRTLSQPTKVHLAAYPLLISYLHVGSSFVYLIFERFIKRVCYLIEMWRTCSSWNTAAAGFGILSRILDLTHQYDVSEDEKKSGVLGCEIGVSGGWWCKLWEYICKNPFPRNEMWRDWWWVVVQSRFDSYTRRSKDLDMARFCGVLDHYWFVWRYFKVLKDEMLSVR